MSLLRQIPFAIFLSCLAICNSFELTAYGQQPRAIPKVPIPDGVLLDEDVEYANPDNQHLKIDLFRPKEGTKPFPTVLVIHGGGFVGGSPKATHRMCVLLAREGFVAAAVQYRLAPKYPFPACVHDCKAAVRWLRANANTYNLDPDRIGATGHSAGGHLVTFLAVTAGIREFEGDGGNGDRSSRVACAVNYYGPMDFTRIQGRSKSEPVMAPFLGGTIATHRKEHIRSSPLFWVTPDAAPVLSINGTKDEHVPHEQAIWITDRLTTAGVEAQVLILDGAGHGFQGEDRAVSDRATLTFLTKHLKREKSPIRENP